MCIAYPSYRAHQWAINSSFFVGCVPKFELAKPPITLSTLLTQDCAQFLESAAPKQDIDSIHAAIKQERCQVFYLGVVAFILTTLTDSNRFEMMYFDYFCTQNGQK